MKKFYVLRQCLYLSAVSMAMISVTATLNGCKTKKKSSNNAPAPVPTPTPTPVPVDNQNANGNPNTPKVIITGALASQPLEYGENQTVRLPLTMSGVDISSSQYEFSLAQMPVGAQLTGRTGAQPEIVWNTAAEGDYDFQVIARDMKLCQQVLSANANQCSIPVSQFGNIQPDSRFDVASTFRVSVKRGSTGPAGTLPANNSGYNYGNNGYAPNGSYNHGSSGGSCPSYR